MQADRTTYKNKYIQDDECIRNYKKIGNRQNYYKIITSINLLYHKD